MAAGKAASRLCKAVLAKQAVTTLTAMQASMKSSTKACTCSVQTPCSGCLLESASVSALTYTGLKQRLGAAYCQCWAALLNETEFFRLWLTKPEKQGQFEVEGLKHEMQPDAEPAKQQET